MKNRQQDALVAALEGRGFSRVPSKTRKFIVLEHPAKPERLYYVGKAGAVRVRHKGAKFTLPIRDALKKELLTEGGYSLKTEHHKFRNGDRVRLAEFKDDPDPENWSPEQTGTIIGIEEENGMIVVELDKEYIEDKDDDGLRECSADQVKELLK